MSASSLKLDIKANADELQQLAKQMADDNLAATGKPIASVGEIAMVGHLQHTLWPFLDGLCDELKAHEDALEEAAGVIDELEEAVDELTEERGTVLMPQEAGVFSLLVQLTRGAVAKLEQGHTLTSDDLGALKIACDASEKTIQETVINVDVDGDDDEEDDDDDDD